MTKRQEFPGVSHFRDRHGKLRWRYRKGTFTVSLGPDYGGPEFLRRYSAAVKGVRLPPAGNENRVLTNSFTDIANRRLRTEEFKSFSKAHQQQILKRLDIAKCRFGSELVRKISPDMIFALVNDPGIKPAAANKLLGAIRWVMEHAVQLGKITGNPAKSVERFRIPNKGYHIWTEEDVEQFYAMHSAGSLARRAMDLMLHTGASRADAVSLGWQNLAENRLRYLRKHTGAAGGTVVDIPITAGLKVCIGAIPPTHTTFLQTANGSQRSPDGLGNKMREWCNKAELPQCTSHGLRKACARRLADAGATPHEIMSVAGYESIQSAHAYTGMGERAELADKAIKRLPASITDPAVSA